MNYSHLISRLDRSIKVSLSAAALLLGLSSLSLAQSSKSMLPAFGPAGAEFTMKAKDGHSTQGWLPKDWTDNSEWAAVNATYSKIVDTPDKEAGGVRIKVEKVDDGQLQLTTYQGNNKFQKGTQYVVSGWLRSPDRLTVKMAARQPGDPYEVYHEQDVTAEPEWQKFEFAFTPTMDLQAFIMFIVRDAGTVDLAGVTVEPK